MYFQSFCLKCSASWSLTSQTTVVSAVDFTDDCIQHRKKHALKPEFYSISATKWLVLKNLQIWIQNSRKTNVWLKSEKTHPPKAGSEGMQKLVCKSASQFSSCWTAGRPSRTYFSQQHQYQSDNVSHVFPLEDRKFMKWGVSCTIKLNIGAMSLFDDVYNSQKQFITVKGKPSLWGQSSIIKKRQ